MPWLTSSRQWKIPLLNSTHALYRFDTIPQDPSTINTTVTPTIPPGPSTTNATVMPKSINPTSTASVTTSNNQSSTLSGGSHYRLSIGMIIGMLVGVIMILLVLGVVLRCYRRRGNKKPRPFPQDEAKLWSGDANFMQNLPNQLHSVESVLSTTLHTPSSSVSKYPRSPSERHYYIVQNPTVEDGLAPSVHVDNQPLPPPYEL